MCCNPDRRNMIVLFPDPPQDLASVVVALDGSPQSKKALGWALSNLMKGAPNCLLHLLSVEYPVAFPVSPYQCFFL